MYFFKLPTENLNNLDNRCPNVYKNDCDYCRIIAIDTTALHILFLRQIE